MTTLLTILLAISPSATPVRAVTIDGRVIEGQWAGSGQEGELRLDVSGSAKAIRMDELLLLKWPAATTTPASETLPLVVYLKDGSRTPARLVEGNAQQLVLETAWDKHLTVPLSQLSAVRFSARQSENSREAFEQALADGKADQDRLIVLRNNRPTTLKGSLESLGADGGSFRWRDRSVPIKPQETVAVVMAPGSSAPAAAPASCLLRDGSIWAGRIAAVESASLRLQPASGTAIEFPIGQISEIRFRSDRVTFLGDLAPARYEFEPFGMTRWPYRVDRSAANRPMRIGGQTFDHGIGMHSRSTLAYDVPKGFHQLAATIGIDDAVGSQGNVVFRVLADGKEVFNSGPVTGAQPHRPLLASIDGTRQIQLIVEFGDDLDLGDQADWADVRLIK
jgi:hypothetical protein